jgi:hypothetical protein
MRNILVHGYFHVDLDAVWTVVERDLDPLESAVRRYVGRNDPPGAHALLASEADPEENFHRDMVTGIDRLDREINYPATRFTQIVNEHRGVAAAKPLLTSDSEDGSLCHVALLARTRPLGRPRAEILTSKFNDRRRHRDGLLGVLEGRIRQVAWIAARHAPPAQTRQIQFRSLQPRPSRQQSEQALQIVGSWKVNVGRNQYRLDRLLSGLLRSQAGPAGATGVARLLLPDPEILERVPPPVAHPPTPPVISGHRASRRNARLPAARYPGYRRPDRSLQH